MTNSRLPAILLKTRRSFTVHKKALIDAFKNLALFSAIIHMLLLAVYSVKTLDFSKFNFFDIIDLDLFFPNAANGVISQILSITIGIIVFIFFYRYSLKNSKKTS